MIPYSKPAMKFDQVEAFTTDTNVRIVYILFTLPLSEELADLLSYIAKACATHFDIAYPTS